MNFQSKSKLNFLNSVLFSFNLFGPLALLLFTVLPLTAGAQSVLPDSDCILAAKGKKVRWDQAWQDDGKDQDAIYLIESVTSKQEPLAVELRLVAVGPATAQIRSATITRGYVAKLFCERLVEAPKKNIQVAHGGGLRALKTQEEIPEGFPSREVIAEDLVFRHWNGSAWVPAKPRPGTSPFVCSLPHRAYACSEADFKMLEESKRRKPDLNLRPYYRTLLPKEFIRYSAEHGWVLDIALGLPIDSIFSSCSIAGVDYSCLAEEKKKYLPELRELEKTSDFYRSYQAQVKGKKN